ncbi:gephyrin-like molybdotransferase Glp [Aquibium sp. ELW1220]|uniref:molybdopterin molybdotransferase MoeA n=1 Tax=Aquibium sp. ELW1220 TaxID=2976766 RepID=UPI0025AF6B51|nr:gephyrin-like molybdotransferase Glp [Aquibium sp. ELW1220]MDN2581589.1 molybdopterin molybdotransferase MoeA [Aquibium sp. ELW1220]
MTLAAVSAQEPCDAGATGTVVPVDIAAAKAAAAVMAVAETETLDLLAANGRVPAAEVRAGLNLPPFNASAMDGYAVKADRFGGPGPWRFAVTGRIAAGDAPRPSFEGSVRILTGAPVPEGFDTVVMQEKCTVDGDDIVIRERPRTGQNVRVAGEDVRRGDMLLREGDLLKPQHLALLAGQGMAGIEVRRRIRVGLVSTGTELREPGERLHPGQIFNSNRVMLRASLDACRWAEVIDFGIVADTREEIAAALAEAAKRCDAIITTGGVSAGEEDHVTSAVSSGGGALDVLKVAMRPGKPVKVGRLGSALFLGLPGNPNATLVTFRMIALPALRKMAGLSGTAPVWTRAVADFTYDKRADRTEFVPVRLGDPAPDGLPRLTMLGRGSSASLRAISQAEGIALLPPGVDRIEPGLPLAFEAM